MAEGGDRIGAEGRRGDVTGRRGDAEEAEGGDRIGAEGRRGDVTGRRGDFCGGGAAIAAIERERGGVREGMRSDTRDDCGELRAREREGGAGASGTLDPHSSEGFGPDPYRHLWELTTARRAVISLQWLKDARGIVISLEDGTLKFVSLSRIANDVPVTGRPLVGMKTQGVSTYQLSEYLIWSVHASEIAGYAAYCVADGTAVCFEGVPTYCPRLVSVGSRGVPWFFEFIRFGNVTRSVSKPHGRNLFLQSLVEEGQNPSTSNGASNSQKSVEDKDLIDCLENGVNFWTDYSKVQYHPQSLYELHGSWTDFDKFDNYGSAQEVVSDWSQIEEMNERLRFFVEECDHIQGIQFIVGDSGSFSSVAAQFLENIADDYTKTPVLLYCVRDPMTLGSSRMNQRESIMRALHDAVSFSKLSSFCSLMVPIGPPSLSRSYMSPYLYIQDEKPFHASAVCAAAIHSITAPFRLQRTGPSSDLAHSSGNLDIGELLHILSDQGRQNMIEMLLGNIEMKLHSLTPEISDEDEDPYSVESLVDFHITSERLGMFSLRSQRDSQNFPISQHLFAPSLSPFRSRQSSGNIGRHGEILSDHAEESQPKGSLDIESIPMAARLRSSSTVLPFIERRSGSLQKHGVARGAIGSLVLRDWGFGREEVDDMGEHLAKLCMPHAAAVTFCGVSGQVLISVKSSTGLAKFPFHFHCDARSHSVGL
uniref:DML1/Misato tubulin domain-containing protein n=1 Tax=Oryza nivara TaxID=4536 RepID=A0A0E0I012_ORYNI